jgi:methionine transaminase
MTSFTTKLPKSGTTIFAIMSAMAREYNAINLSQGFPDFPVSPQLIDLIHHYMRSGHNQYAPMQGVAKLREMIAHKAALLYGHAVSADTEVTVTAGATEAIFATIMAMIKPDDEVIVLEPAYDCYIPSIELAGGKAIPLPLNQPDFSINWSLIRHSMTKNTRMLMINSPHNPSGAVINATDLQELKSLLLDFPNLFVLSDEVYEHIIFDGLKHESVLQDEFIKSRAIAVFSFGKTFHATGWKIGYTIAPDWLSREIRKMHQYITFSVNTPVQMALADYLEQPENYNALPDFYQQKRDEFLKQIEGSAFHPISCSGTYFQLLSYADISDEPDTKMAELLTKKHGLASIPISVFYADKKDDRILRFCFAKGSETLAKAGEILRKFKL